jgi:hypothetical protein
MQTLTKQEALNTLMNVKGTTFMSIETTTIPKLKAKNPFKDLKKVSLISGAIGFNYENSVNNQREREGLENNFESKPRAWGHRIDNTPVVEHKGKHYLEVKVQSSKSEYFDGDLRIDVDKIKPWMYSNSSRQELNKEVIVRDYSLDSIFRMNLNKKEYRIV